MKKIMKRFRDQNFDIRPIENGYIAEYSICEEQYCEEDNEVIDYSVDSKSVYFSNIEDVTQAAKYFFSLPIRK